MVRRRVLATGLLLLLGGCDDGGGATAQGPIGSKAPELVFFQRQGAGGATLDTFTVRRDGSARLEKRYGGAGGRFKDLELRDGVLPGGVVPAARPAVRILDGFIDGVGVRKVTRENATHAP